MRRWWASVCLVLHLRNYVTDFGINAALLNKGERKFVLVFFVNWAPRHEGVSGEWKYSSTHSLTSALDGGEWSASRPAALSPGKEPLLPPLDRRLGGPQTRSGRDGEEKQIPSPRRESNPITPIMQPVT
jgi:hypothetical protein